MRYWNKFIDKHVMNYVSMHGWHRMVGVIARGLESGEFSKLVERIPLHEQREKWKTARSALARRILGTPPEKCKWRLTRLKPSCVLHLGLRVKCSPWRTSNSLPLRHDARAMFPEIGKVARCPRLLDWEARVRARPGVAAALRMPDHTNPALRTFTGHVT